MSKERISWTPELVQKVQAEMKSSGVGLFQTLRAMKLPQGSYHQAANRFFDKEKYAKHYAKPSQAKIRGKYKKRDKEVFTAPSGPAEPKVITWSAPDISSAATAPHDEKVAIIITTRSQVNNILAGLWQ